MQAHVGGINIAHNKAFMKALNLLRQNQHIETIICKQIMKECVEYRSCLEASIKVVRFLLKRGLACRAHDEIEDSKNPDNFIDLLKFLPENNVEADNVVRKNAPENLKLTAPSIQKDIVNACAIETVNVIVSDLGDSFFSILVDESRDISIKEQIVVAVRYVDKQGCVMERIVGFVHVSDTTAMSLKKAIDNL